MTVLDADNRLTADYRGRVAAAIPPDVEVPGSFWTALEEIVVGFVQFRARHKTYPIAAERKRWKRIGDAVETLGAELRRLRRVTPWSDPDPLWPNRALTALWSVRKRVESMAAYHEIWSTFRGRRNAHRDFLYGGVLDCWTRLGEELRYSRNATNEVGGPTVRFFVACIEPVLGDKMIGSEAIAGIIDREKKGRADFQCELKQLRSRWERDDDMGF